MKKKKEEINFEVEIQKGEDKLNIAGWVKGDAYDLDKVSINDNTRFMEEDGNDEVNRFKDYLGAIAGLQEPSFPHAAAAMGEMHNLELDETWAKGVSRFVKK